MSEYSLAISDVEVGRYRMMAERARLAEAELWREAGVVPGAVVADVGCGPAAMSVVLARAVEPGGRVIGVERDEGALEAAGQVVAESGVGNVELRSGSATDTGFEAGAVDVAMCRNVLAHNGRDEQRIVDHLAEICRPGGVVYLVDVDATAMRALDLDPDLEDLTEKYHAFHRERGNDLQTGVRLAALLRAAGLDVLVHDGRYSIIAAPPGLRPPPWAARQAMVAAGIATEGDVERWGRAFDRMDAAPVRPTLFVPQFVALGRKPG